MAKRNSRAANFSLTEKDVLSQILPQFPVIEHKRKTNGVDVEKQAAWRSIADKFNSDERVTQRLEAQLKAS